MTLTSWETLDHPVVRARAAYFPDFAFWYHMGFAECVALPPWAVKVYADALPRLIAELKMLHSQAAQYPWLDDKSKQDMVRDMNFTLHNSGVTKKPEVAQEDMYSQLEAIGIGVVQQ